MDSLDDILAPDGVAAHLAVPNKKALFQLLGASASRLLGVDARIVADRLSDRERLGSTGFGGGVAIPHAKLEGLDRVTGMVARLSTPIDFSAVDDLPVDIVFLLLSPLDTGVEHLKALARVSRRLRDRALVAKLRGAGSKDALFALFATAESRDAA